MRVGMAAARALVEDLGRERAFAAPVNGASFLGGAAAFALGDGKIAMGEAEPFAVHEGAILAAVQAPDGKAIITTGDDGLVCRTTADETTSTLHDAKGKWIDAVAAAPESGAIAFTAGREVRVLTPKGEVHVHVPPRTPNALAFDAKGRRLALAHADAVTLVWALGPKMPVETLKWSGAHVAVGFRPQGDFLVTGMSEGALHGWRMADKVHFRMTGYPFKPRALSFGLKGRVLATSGAGVVLLWPFEGRDGPMGKSARQLPARHGLVTAVACHPRDPLLAAGFADGGVHLLRMEDGADIWVGGPPPPAQSPDDPLKAQTAIEHLAWSADGMSLAWGGQDGRAGWVTLPG